MCRGRRLAESAVAEAHFSANVSAHASRVPSRATHGIMTPATVAAGSFLTVQALRAVAALLVVVHHAFEMWEARITPDAPGPSWTNGAAGVDIFFVISGFVMVIASRRILSRPQAALVFMEHRIARIVPLYWLLTTAKLALVVLFAGLALRSTLDLDYLLRSYLFLPLLDHAGHFRPLLPVGWTLTYEFLFYLLFALALALRADVLRVLVPAFALIVMLALLRTASWPVWTILFNTIVVEFLFGVLIAKATLRGFTLPAVLAALMVLSGFLLILAIPQSAENLRVLTWGLPACAIVAGAVSLETHIAAALPRWLLALGDASYSIYLVHGFVVPAIGVAFVASHWNTAAARAVTVFACLIGASFAGWLLYLVVERPIMTLFRKRATD